MLREDKADTYKQQKWYTYVQMLVDDVGFNEIFSIEAIIKGTCVILYHVENNLECVYLKIVPICSMAKWEQTVKWLLCVIIS